MSNFVKVAMMVQLCVSDHDEENHDDQDKLMMMIVEYRDDDHV